MKKFWGPKCESKGSKLCPKFVFCHFLKFAQLVSLDIAQDCSLRQFLASSRAEISKKNLWPKLSPK